MDAVMEVWMVALLDLREDSGVEILKVVSEDKNLILSNLFLPRPNFQALVDGSRILHQIVNG